MKAVVDQDSCIGCGLCVQVAPDVFTMDGDKAVAVSANVSGEMLEQAKSGADQCPVNAITVS